MKSMVIEVNYEPGAEPYTGAALGRVDVWNFFGDNLKAIFQGRSSVPSIVFPHTVSQMKSLPPQNKQLWSMDDVEALANQQRQTEASSSVGDFYIVFLNGYFSDDGKSPKTDVLGFNIAGTPIIAIFKQVIVNSSSGEHHYVAAYVEQSTIVHEMGHALGMVNDGLPMTTSHQDAPNGAHCTNTKCVMYWENEGGMAARKFVRGLKHGHEIVWGAECLQDSHVFSP
jgi:hypothetical protein